MFSVYRSPWQVGGEHDQSATASWLERTLRIAVCAFAGGMIDKTRFVACDCGVDEDGIVELEHIIPPAMMSDVAKVQKIKIKIIHLWLTQGLQRFLTFVKAMLLRMSIRQRILIEAMSAVQRDQSALTGKIALTGNQFIFSRRLLQEESKSMTAPLHFACLKRLSRPIVVANAHTTPTLRFPCHI